VEKEEETLWHSNPKVWCGRNEGTGFPGAAAGNPGQELGDREGKGRRIIISQTLLPLKEERKNYLILSN
jgi:hypothetical protein